MNTRNRFRPGLTRFIVVLICLLAGCRSAKNALPPTAAPTAASPSIPLPQRTTAAPPSVTPHPAAAPRTARIPHPIANAALTAYPPTTRLFDRGHNTSPPRVALTFDCCYSDIGVPLILKTLEEHHLHCTFFMAGFFCNHYPASARRIADAGMELGNHSYNHPHFTKLNDEKVLDQLDDAESSIERACGRGAKPLFRFPYGDSDRRTRKEVVEAGYQPIHWTLDSLDSVGHPKSESFLVSRIETKIKPGSITLMHVSCAESARALPKILDYLDKNGYQVVPVSELLLEQQAAAKSPTKPTRVTVMP